MTSPQVELSEDGNYGVLKITGPFSIKSAVEHAGAMNGFSEETGINRFLLDVRGTPYRNSIGSQYFFVREELPKFSESRFWRVAVLTSENDTSHDFVETVSQNAGFNLKVFKHYDEARDWLKWINQMSDR